MTADYLLGFSSRKYDETSDLMKQFLEIASYPSSLDESFF